MKDEEYIHPAAAPRTSWVFWRHWLWLAFKHSVKCPLYMVIFVHFVVQPTVYPLVVSSLRHSRPMQAVADWMGATLPMNGRDPMDTTVFMAMTLGLHTALYGGMCGFFLLCDRFGWLSRYKLPRDARTWPSPALLQRTVVEAAVSQLLVDPIVLFLIITRLARFPAVFEADGVTPSRTSDMLNTAVQIFGAHIVNEMGFYITHRLAHEVPWLYKAIHKQHHQYVGPASPAAEYANPIETVITAQIPTLGWCVLFSSQVHPVVWLSWLAWRTSETYECHSGYCFKGTWLDKLGLLNANLTEHHEFHHTVNKGNYGTEVTDMLFGTMATYLSHKKAARERRRE